MIDEYVYVPGVTAVLASAIVPDVVIVPPVKPVPAVMLVTVPLDDPVLAAVMRPCASTVIEAFV